MEDWSGVCLNMELLEWCANLETADMGGRGGSWVYE